jgi:hypothetical protein
LDPAHISSVLCAGANSKESESLLLKRIKVRLKFGPLFFFTPAAQPSACPPHDHLARPPVSLTLASPPSPHGITSLPPLSFPSRLCPATLLATVQDRSTRTPVALARPSAPQSRRRRPGSISPPLPSHRTSPPCSLSSPLALHRWR